MSCTHTIDYSRYEEVEVSPWGDTEMQWVERIESTYTDISLGAFKCTQCGEVGYYTGKWKRFYEEGVPCSGSDQVALIDKQAIKPKGTL